MGLKAQASSCLFQPNCSLPSGRSLLETNLGPMFRAAGVASLFVVGDAMTCPGSATILPHAGMKITATAAASCDTVKAEMKARIAGANGWYDQHNKGTYTEQSYGGDFS